MNYHIFLENIIIIFYIYYKWDKVILDMEIMKF